MDGSLNRREATGRGIYTVSVEAARQFGLKIEGARVAVQNFSSSFWTEAEISQRLIKIMKGTFGGVWNAAGQHKVSPRTAAGIVACTRILTARNLHGPYS